MDDPHPVSDACVQDFATTAISRVCSTLIRREAKFVARTEALDLTVARADPFFLGCVDFKGRIDGRVYLCVPESFARDAASVILGSRAADGELEGENLVHDVIGELTNMTAGCFKNALCDIGYPCKLTIPSVFRGTNPKMAVLHSARRYTFHFDCRVQRIVTDIQLCLH